MSSLEADFTFKFQQAFFASERGLVIEERGKSLSERFSERSERKLTQK